MISAFVLHMILVTGVFAVTAAILDVSMQRLGWQTRWIWVWGILLSLTVPLFSAFGPSAGIWPVFVTPNAVELGMSPGVTSLYRVDDITVVVWVLLSVGVGLFFFRTYAAVRRARRGWRQENLLGTPVLVTRDVGPAVVGFVRPAIVVPEWVTTEPRGVQELILAHEREHVFERDPLLVLLGGLCLVAVPWNLALWWIVNRMRLAAETDCDARVLGEVRYADVEAYGTTLIEVGRRMLALQHPVLAMSASGGQLERRITRMANARVGGDAITALSALGAVAMIASVWMLPHPVFRVDQCEIDGSSVVAPYQSGRVIMGIIPGQPKILKILDDARETT